MAISTLTGVLAGFQQLQALTKSSTALTVQGRPQSWFTIAGSPGAGSPSGSLNGAVFSSSSSVPAGMIQHVDPVGGNAYLARFEANMNNPGQVLLCDRLWDNGGITITSTTAQTIVSPTWPARDNTGTTNGVGVMLAVEVTAATGAGTPTLTIGYTNSSGTASRTATNFDATAASEVIGAFHRMSLQAGDVGVQSVQSITLSATWTSGTINVVAYRVLATVEVVAAGWPGTLDAVTSGFPQLFNGVCPFLVCVPQLGSVNMGFSGVYLESQG